MTRTRYHFEEGLRPHFLICTVVAWLPVFTRREAVQIVFDSWSFLQQENSIRLLGYVVLENHLHWIAVGDDLSRQVARFKSYTARRLLDLMEAKRAHQFLEILAYYKLRHKVDQDLQFWQEGSHPEVIENDEMMRQKLEYIHNNPLQRGYVDDPLHWRYSSARNYARQPGLVEVTTDW